MLTIDYVLEILQLCKFDFSKKFYGGAHQALSPSPNHPRFFLVFALNSRAFHAFDSGFVLESRALRALHSGYALNFLLGNLVSHK